MGCGCRGGSNSKGSGGDLTKFAFLSPRQLRIRDRQLAAQKAAEDAANPEKNSDE